MIFREHVDYQPQRTDRAGGMTAASAWIMAAAADAQLVHDAGRGRGGARLGGGTTASLAAILAALVASALIQLGTNLHNDAADSRRGGDGPDRVGPPRATALAAGRAVDPGHGCSFAVAALLGAYLIWVGGWPIFLLGVLSILSGWAYTGGPLPIAYTPLGELFVVAFFGLGAVCGTYWLCTETIAPAAIEAGLAVGCLTGAVLLVNNHRDAEADARVGRRTGDRGRPGRDRLDLCGADADPFALLVPIAQALPAGRVWPALIACRRGY